MDRADEPTPDLPGARGGSAPQGPQPAPTATGRDGAERRRLVETLDLPATDPSRYAWEAVKPGDQDHMPVARRLLHVVADRIRWQQALVEARRRAQGLPPQDLSATGEAA